MIGGTHFGKRRRGILGVAAVAVRRRVEKSPKLACCHSRKAFSETKDASPVNKSSKWIHRANRKTYKVRDHFVDSSVGLLGTDQNERCQHDPVLNILPPTREQTLRWMEREKSHNLDEADVDFKLSRRIQLDDN